MKITVFVLALAIGSSCYGQQYMSDLGGRVVLSKAPGYNIEGNYFYLPDFKKATLIFANTKAKQELPVKLDLLDNTVIFQDDKGAELTVSTPLKEIYFPDKNALFRTGYPAVKDLKTSAYYQVLDTGKVTLLKHYNVTFWDAKGYNSPTPTRTFEQNPSYFIYDGTQVIPLEKGGVNGWLDAATGADKEKLSGYIKSSGLKFKKEEDYIALTRFYNKG